MMPPSCATPVPEAPRRTKVGVHVRRLVIALGVFIIVAASAHGQTPVFIEDFGPSDMPFRIKAVKCGKQEASIMRGTGCVARIGDVVSLEIQNLASWLEKLKTDKVIASGETGEALVVEQLPKLCLFIDEHWMKTLQPTEYKKDDPEWYPADSVQRKAAPGRSWLEFTLKRDAANKADWDPVLRTHGISPKMELAVGIYDHNRNIVRVMALPVGADKAEAQLQFHFQLIVWDRWTVVGLTLLGVAVLVFGYMSVRSGMVRDTTCPVREDGLPPFSLGRCQMAFWFFLVISAFYFLWVITGHGDTDTINSTVLTLIGISAGTALGSAIVSKNEAATSAAEGKVPPPPDVVYPVEIKKAQTTLAAAKADREKIAPSDTAAISAKDAEIEEQTSKVARLKGDLKRWRALNRWQWLQDLLSDEDASAGQGRVITFHRFQIVVWTLILGIVFVSEVLTKLAMPVFDNTLLTLMGISSGTYLGFKVSAK